MMCNIVVFGANSAICQALLRLYAVEEPRLFLVARSREKLEATTADLQVRGAVVRGMKAYDFVDWEQHKACLSEARECLGEIDLIIVGHGTLPKQEECEVSGSATKSALDDNFTSAAIIVQQSAAVLDRQKRGTLAVFSSVAGDRGRKSNYTYGAAKAGLDTLLEGLRGRFAGSDVSIVTIKPGMIQTPMTEEMPHGLLWSTPEKIAPGIHRAIDRGRAVCYAPGYWRLIMLIIRVLPTGIMARLPI